MNADDGLEYIRWIRGLGGEKLPATSYALLPNLKKLYFCHRRGIENFGRLFSTQQRPNLVVSDAWQAPATDHLPFVNTVTRGWVGPPMTSAPRSNFMVQPLVLSINVCRGLGISPLRINLWLSFSQADLGPTFCPGMIFFVFCSKVLELFV